MFLVSDMEMKDMGGGSRDLSLDIDSSSPANVEIEITSPQSPIIKSPVEAERQPSPQSSESERSPLMNEPQNNTKDSEKVDAKGGDAEEVTEKEERKSETSEEKPTTVE